MKNLPLLLFDVNGTLLDPGALDPLFEATFGAAHLRHAWFDRLLQGAQALTLAGRYADFGTLVGSALEIIAARHEVALPAVAKARILDEMARLPPWPGVPDALATLESAGFRLAVLSNSSPATLQRQLDHAGLARFFERILSVDAVRRYKPAPEPYRMAAVELGLEPAALCMVAAHDWDILGAMCAGISGAFIARPGKLWPKFLEPPTVIGRDLGMVAEGLTSVYRKV